MEREADIEVSVGPRLQQDPEDQTSITTLFGPVALDEHGFELTVTRSPAPNILLGIGSLALALWTFVVSDRSTWELVIGLFASLFALLVIFVPIYNRFKLGQLSRIDRSSVVQVGPGGNPNSLRVKYRKEGGTEDVLPLFFPNAPARDAALEEFRSRGFPVGLFIKK